MNTKSQDATQILEAGELVQPQSMPLAVQQNTPAYLLQVAVQQGADLAKLEKLMDLQERWEEREAEKAYNEAFAAFKAEAVKIVKNRSVTAGPLSGKKYAELFAIVKAITPALSKHGLSAAWRITKDEPDWIEVTCTLKHAKGHSESVPMGGPPDDGGAKNKIQARASTVTYLERYTLKAITGLSEEEDDTDGGTCAQAGVPNEAFAKLVDAGYAKASEGMAALTAWWGTLNAKQRSDLNKEFANMRKDAAAADKGGANA